MELENATNIVRASREALLRAAQFEAIWTREIMNTNDCPTCTLLWRDYAAATHAHIGIESKLDLARLKYDHEAIQRLLPAAQSAADLRRGLRQQIGVHEREAHPINGAAPEGTSHGIVEV